MESLLYISESTIEAGMAHSELGRIVATSRLRNPLFGITGALLFTGSHFAQVLEGEEDRISSLIAAITRDKRHTRLDIVSRYPIVWRRFPDWSMAYHGPSQFVSRHVNRLMNDRFLGDRSKAAEWLEEVLAQLTGDDGPEPEEHGGLRSVGDR
jgi:hypothetical protein